MKGLTHKKFDQFTVGSEMIQVGYLENLSKAPETFSTCREIFCAAILLYAMRMGLKYVPS